MRALRLAAVVAAHDHAVGRDVDGLGPRTLQQTHAARQEVVLEGRRHLGVLLRQHLLAADDEGDVAAERPEHVHELHAGDARPDDHEVRGQLGRGVGVAGGEHALAVDVRPVGDAGPAAGAEHDDVGFEQLGALGGLDLDLVGADQATGALDEADALAAEQAAHRALESGLDGGDALLEGVEVDLGRHPAQAHALGLVEVAHGTAGGDHGLRRDAVPQVRRAADDVALDDGDLGAEAGSGGGGLVPRGATTDDDEAHGHASRLPVPGRCQKPC